ncbi:unnamed protein product, partial [Symbiodinium sp. KB8]
DLDALEIGGFISWDSPKETTYVTEYMIYLVTRVPEDEFEYTRIPYKTRQLMSVEAMVNSTNHTDADFNQSVEDDDSSEASDPTNPANITDGEDSDSDRPSKA